MGTSNDKAGYYSDVLVWFDSVNVRCSQKKKSKPKDEHWLRLKFYYFSVYMKMFAPSQHEVSTHLHHSN